MSPLLRARSSLQSLKSTRERSQEGLGFRLVFEVFEELHKFVVWEAFARAPNSFAERAKVLWRLGLSVAAAGCCCCCFFSQWVVVGAIL